MVPSVDAIAAAYLRRANGDADAALRAAVADALASSSEAEWRTRRAERLISFGYTRGRLGGPAAEHLSAAEAQVTGEAATRAGV